MVQDKSLLADGTPLRSKRLVHQRDPPNHSSHAVIFEGTYKIPLPDHDADDGPITPESVEVPTSLLRKRPRLRSDGQRTELSTKGDFEDEDAWTTTFKRKSRTTSTFQGRSANRDVSPAIFPLVLLPEARTSCSSVTQQIRDFFSSPVPALFCGTGDNGWELGGILMEYHLRKLVDADIGGDLRHAAGWGRMPTQLSRWVSYAERRVLDEERGTIERARKRVKLQKGDTINPRTGMRLPKRGPGGKFLPASAAEHKRHRLGKKKRPISKAHKSSQQWTRLAGALARKAEAIWDGPEEMKALYQKKRYLKAGLYSSVYKSDNLSKLRPRAYQTRFSFPLPVNHGTTLLQEEFDFELPYDIVTHVALLGGPTALKAQATKKSPSPFYRIQKNIFVDRKPHKTKEVPVCQCEVPFNSDPACRDNCLNRCMFIECSPKHCPANERCSNQRFQKRESIKELEVVWTAVRGHGLRTKVNIPRGSMVIEYRGEIISQDTCIERMETIYKDVENYYFLNYARGEVIDACRKGTEARLVDGEYCVGLFSSEDIFAGSELTYDYRFEAFGPMQQCLCGAKSCRGFIGLNKKVEAKQDPAKSKKTGKQGKSKAKSSKVKRIKVKSYEREFWLRKHQREKLASQYKDVLKNRGFYADTGLFLVRNMGSVVAKELGERHVSAPGGSTPSTTRNRRAGSGDDDVVDAIPKLSPDIVRRRRRGLDAVIEDLWLVRKALFPGDTMGNNIADGGALEDVELEPWSDNDDMSLSYVEADDSAASSDEGDHDEFDESSTESDSAADSEGTPGRHPALQSKKELTTIRKSSTPQSVIRPAAVRVHDVEDDSGNLPSELPGKRRSLRGRGQRAMMHLDGVDTEHHSSSTRSGAVLGEDSEGEGSDDEMLPAHRSPRFISPTAKRSSGRKTPLQRSFLTPDRQKLSHTERQLSRSAARESGSGQSPRGYLSTDVSPILQPGIKKSGILGGTTAPMQSRRSTDDTIMGKVPLSKQRAARALRRSIVAHARQEAVAEDRNESLSRRDTSPEGNVDSNAGLENSSGTKVDGFISTLRSPGRPGIRNHRRSDLSADGDGQSETKRADTVASSHRWSASSHGIDRQLQAGARKSVRRSLTAEAMKGGILPVQDDHGSLGISNTTQKEGDASSSSPVATQEVDAVAALLSLSASAMDMDDDQTTAIPEATQVAKDQDIGLELRASLIRGEHASPTGKPLVPQSAIRTYKGKTGKQRLSMDIISVDESHGHLVNKENKVDGAEHNTGQRQSLRRLCK
ncbi:histone-lysine N-methyltransferase [Spizellomyces sp. 'palustris']|nr:histone-lysine N-methyltransferase [Spizellomyces sp. 'palustris']